MGSLVEKICLDSDVCIAIIKKDKRLINFKIEQESEAYISVITIFELLLRKTNLEIIEKMLNHFHHLQITTEVARKTSELHKKLAERGELIDLKDLFIAASCIVNECSLLTFNKKHFERIEGLKMI